MRTVLHSWSRLVAVIASHRFRLALRVLQAWQVVTLQNALSTQLYASHTQRCIRHAFASWHTTMQLAAERRHQLAQDADYVQQQLLTWKAFMSWRCQVSQHRGDDDFVATPARLFAFPWPNAHSADHSSAISHDETDQLPETSVTRCDPIPIEHSSFDSQRWDPYNAPVCSSAVGDVWTHTCEAYPAVDVCSHTGGGNCGDSTLPPGAISKSHGAKMPCNVVSSFPQTEQHTAWQRVTKPLEGSANALCGEREHTPACWETGRTDSDAEDDLAHQQRTHMWDQHPAQLGYCDDRPNTSWSSTGGYESLAHVDVDSRHESDSGNELFEATFHAVCEKASHRSEIDAAWDGQTNVESEAAAHAFDAFDTNLQFVAEMRQLKGVVLRQWQQYVWYRRHRARLHRAANCYRHMLLLGRSWTAWLDAADSDSQDVSANLQLACQSHACIDSIAVCS